MSAAELRKAAEAERAEWGGENNARTYPRSAAIHLALADWLDYVVAVGEPGRRNGLSGEPYDFQQALAVARLINGEVSA